MCPRVFHYPKNGQQTTGQYQCVNLQNIISRNIAETISCTTVGPQKFKIRSPIFCPPSNPNLLAKHRYTHIALILHLTLTSCSLTQLHQ